MTDQASINQVGFIAGSTNHLRDGLVWSLALERANAWRRWMIAERNLSQDALAMSAARFGIAYAGWPFNVNIYPDRMHENARIFAIWQALGARRHPPQPVPA